MQLEKLKSSKFDAFKGNEISNALKLEVAGGCTPTHMGSPTGPADTYSKDFTGKHSEDYDYQPGHCPIAIAYGGFSADEDIPDHPDEQHLAWGWTPPGDDGSEG